MGLITVTISCPINTCVLFLNKRTNTKLPKLPSSSTSYDNTVTDGPKIFRPIPSHDLKKTSNRVLKTNSSDHYQFYQ